MANRIGLGLAAALVAVAVAVVVLLATDWHALTKQDTGARLIEAAAGHQGLAALSLVDEVRNANAEHPALACAGEDLAVEATQIPREVFSYLQLPQGSWLVSKRGKAEGTSYILIYNSEARPNILQPFGADLREVDLPEGKLTCLVPKTSAS